MFESCHSASLKLCLFLVLHDSHQIFLVIIEPNWEKRETCLISGDVFIRNLVLILVFWSVSLLVVLCWIITLQRISQQEWWLLVVAIFSLRNMLQVVMGYMVSPLRVDHRPDYLRSLLFPQKWADVWFTLFPDCYYAILHDVTAWTLPDTINCDWFDKRRKQV